MPLYCYQESVLRLSSELFAGFDGALQEQTRGPGDVAGRVAAGAQPEQTKRRRASHTETITHN